MSQGPGHREAAEGVGGGRMLEPGFRGRCRSQEGERGGGGGCGKCCLSLEMLGMCWEWFEGYQGVSDRRSLDIARCSWEQQSLQDLEVVWGTLEPLLRGTEPLFHYSLFVCACVSGVHVLKCVCKGQKTL